MVKAYAKCKLCGTTKFLNFAQLCKRCNKKPESAIITEQVLAKQEQLHAMQEARMKEQDKFRNEMEALEKMESLTSEQEKRLKALQEQFKVPAKEEEKEEEAGEPGEGKEKEDKGEQKKGKEEKK